MERSNKVKFGIFIGIVAILSLLAIKRVFRMGQYGSSLYILLFDAVAVTVGALFYKKGVEETKKLLLSQKTIAVALMLIPVLISFQTISGTTEKGGWLIHWSETFTTSIKPGLLSTIFALSLFMAIIIRNNPKELFEKKIVYAFTVIDVLFLASFINILCSPEPLPIPLLNLNCQSFLIIAVALSWIGMRSVVGFVWIAILIMSVSRLVNIDNAMGFTGAVYILCSFVSVILQWKTLNIHLSLEGFKQEFLAPAAKQIKGDMQASIDVMPDVAQKIGDVAQKTGASLKESASFVTEKLGDATAARITLTIINKASKGIKGLDLLQGGSQFLGNVVSGVIGSKLGAASNILQTTTELSKKAAEGFTVLKFECTEKGREPIIYSVDSMEKEFLGEYPKYTLELKKNKEYTITAYEASGNPFFSTGVQRFTQDTQIEIPAEAAKLLSSLQEEPLAIEEDQETVANSTELAEKETEIKENDVSGV